MSGDIASLYGGQGFDTDREDAATGFEPLPPGWYQVLIEETAIKDTQAGDGKYLWLKLSVVGERFNNRKIFARITLVNPNEKAVTIGQSELAALGQACGLATITDSSQLLDKLIDVRVKIGRAREGFEPDNEITAYAAGGTKSGGAAAAPAPRAPKPTGAAKPAPAPAPSSRAAKRPWER